MHIDGHYTMISVIVSMVHLDSLMPRNAYIYASVKKSVDQIMSLSLRVKCTLCFADSKTQFVTVEIPFLVMSSYL